MGETFFKSNNKKENDEEDDGKNPKWGKYLGEGAISKVYEVTYDGKKYAGKKIKKSLLTNEKIKTLLLREIDTLFNMNNCDNSVFIIKHYEEENNTIIILELCDKKLEDIIPKEGFNDDMIYLIMNQLNTVFDILYYKNIINKDLNPKNIMVKYTNDNHSKFLVKIKNYGFSSEINDIKSRLSGNLIYMAPEILLGQKYDKKVDLWSIGIMIYYLHFKEYPFNIPDFNDKNDIEKCFNTKKKKNFGNSILDDLVNKLLIYNPSNRISWKDYFNHPFYKNRLVKRFSGNQYILINVNMVDNINKYYLINDGNYSDFVMVEPKKFDELTEENTDMYVNGELVKFKRFLYKEELFNENNESEQKEIKYVFDHKLTRLDYMFFGCETINSVKFVNVDTSLVTTMAFMFSGCYKLRNVDLTCFNTRNLKNIFNSFFAGPFLEEIDLSSFDFSNIDDMDDSNYGAVFGRSGIGKIIVSKTQNKEKIRNILIPNWRNGENQNIIYK